MNDSADSVEEIKPHQDLSCNFFDQIEWKSFVVISFQDLKQVYTKNFKNHAEMISIRGFVQERVEQVKYMTIIPVKGRFVGLVFF